MPPVEAVEIVVVTADRIGMGDKTGESSLFSGGYDFQYFTVAVDLECFAGLEEHIEKVEKVFTKSVGVIVISRSFCDDYNKRICILSMIGCTPWNLISGK